MIHLLACLGYLGREFETIKTSYLNAALSREQALRLQPVLRQQMILLQEDKQTRTQKNVAKLESDIKKIKQQINALFVQSQDEMRIANEQSYQALTKSAIEVISDDSTNFIGLSVEQLEFEMAADAARYFDSPQSLKDIEEKEKEIRKRQEELRSQHQRFAGEQQQNLVSFFNGIVKNSTVGAGAGAGAGTLLPPTLPNPPLPTPMPANTLLNIPSPSNVSKRGGKKNTRRKKQKQKRRKSVHNK